MITKHTPEELEEQLSLLLELPERAAIIEQSEKKELLLQISKMKETRKNFVLNIVNHNPEQDFNNLLRGLSIKGFDLEKLNFLEQILQPAPPQENIKPLNPEKLALADRLVILNCLQDVNKFPKYTGSTKKQDWNYFLSKVLTEPEHNFKKAETSANDLLRKKNPTKKQAENFRDRLTNIKAIFEKSGITGILPAINNRLNELQEIINENS